MSSFIKPSELYIYGINSFINKFNNVSETDTKDIINLDNLKQLFKIDLIHRTNKEQTKLPSFTSLTYNETIKSESGNTFSTSYNRPPIGPINTGCYCSFCHNKGPPKSLDIDNDDEISLQYYHEEDCPEPDKKSLYLTFYGIYEYIIKNENYSGEYENFKKLWLDKTITIYDINKYLVGTGINLEDYSNEDYKNELLNFKNNEINNTLTNIRYLDVIKVRGPTKIAYETATTKFSNAVLLTYEYKDTETKNTSIRIYNNGLINLISVPKEKSIRDELYNELIKRINDADVPSGTVIDIDNFNELVKKIGKKSTEDKESKEYEIIDDISYIHSLNCKFDMWEIKNEYELDFSKLNNLISPYNSSGNIVSGKYTIVKTTDSKQNITLKYKNTSMKLINWEYSADKSTRYGTKTREFIKCILIPIEGIKITLLIHKHGSFQMSMSYCNTSDVVKQICNTIVNKAKIKLEYKYFELVKTLFSGILLEEGTYIISRNILYSSEESKSGKNTVSGKLTIYGPNGKNNVCRPENRPKPYSFDGECPENTQYINPIGELSNDGNYYPCCSKKTGTSEQDYNKYLLTGFPMDKKQEKKYGVNSKIDTKSGILVPGSYNIGSITKANIKGSFKDVQIINYLDKKNKDTFDISINPKKFKVKILSPQEDEPIYTIIDREQLERDSRYFPGLKYFTKQQLIECILYWQSKQNKEIKTYPENLIDIKSLIDIPSSNYNPILIYNDIDIFTKFPYYVSSVPKSTNMYYLVITTNNNYFINIYGNIIKNDTTNNLSIDVPKTIILNGFLNEETGQYYIFDILYYEKIIDQSVTFSDKLELLVLLQTDLYLDFYKSIQILEFNTNIINSSNKLLNENNDIILLFIPEYDVTKNLKIWLDTNVSKEIVLQIQSKNKNVYSLGFNNIPIGINNDINYNIINISKKLKGNNELNIYEYYLFNYDFNKITGKLSELFLIPIKKVDKPNLTFQDTLIKMSLITNPIKISFFTDSMWIIPNTNKYLEFVADDKPLKEEQFT